MQKILYINYLHGACHTIWVTLPDIRIQSLYSFFFDKNNACWANETCPALPIVHTPQIILEGFLFLFLFSKQDHFRGKNRENVPFQTTVHIQNSRTCNAQKIILILNLTDWKLKKIKIIILSKHRFLFGLEKEN